MIRRLLAGLGLSGGIILVTIIGQVMAVPIYLTRWGAQAYGEWLTLTNLVAGLSVLNLGVQSYVGNRLITYYVREEREKVITTLHAALRLYVVLCGLALAATVALIAWPGILAWLQISATPAVQARVIIGVQGMLVTYAILGGLLMGLFRVVNQLPRQLVYSLVERIILLAAPSAIALIGGQPVHASLAVGVLMILVGGIALRDVIRRFPYPIGLRNASWQSSLALIRPSLAFFAVSIAASILLTGMTIAISTILGAVAVAVFGTMLMLTNLVRIVAHQGLNVLWPEITAAAATGGRRGQLADWHRVTLKLVGISGLAGAAGISLLGPDILKLWTRGKIEVDPWLNLLLAIYLLIQAPALVSAVFGLATNRQSDLLRVQVATAAISVFLGWRLISAIGLRGAPIALIAGQTIGTIWTTRLACHWVSDTRSRLLSEVFVRGLPTVITVALVSLGVWYTLSGTVGHLLGSITVLIIAVLLGWATWFTPSERNLLSIRMVTAALRTSPQIGTQGISA